MTTSSTLHGTVLVYICLPGIIINIVPFHSEKHLIEMVNYTVTLITGHLCKKTLRHEDIEDVRDKVMLDLRFKLVITVLA